MEALSLIDVAAEDDLLLDLASPPQLHRDPPKSGSPVGAASDPEAGQVVDPCGATEQLHEQSESPKRRKGKASVNLRKSMAWDSAFFTSEGVLDTEELAVVNSTFRKAQCSRLPGISEELRRSGESTASTIESESWVLESLETELFDNVRASIQRSLSKPEKAPGMTAATTKLPKSTTIVPRVAAKKGADLMPKTRPPISTSHGVVGGKQRPQATLKEPGAARVALPGSTEAKPSLKPLRALPRVATMRAPTNTTMASGISNKRSSTGGVVNKQAAGKSANIAASMHSRPAGVMKSSSTSKSCALSSSAAAAAASIDNIPGPKTKSSILSNKNRTAQRIPVRSSSRTDINKVNPARALKNKIPSRGHSDRAPPSISPNSSLDSMSSVLSGASTASTVGKMSHTSESFSTQCSLLSPSLRKSNDRPPAPKMRPPTITERQSSVVASGDNSKASADAITQGKGSKQSGLRMPTPKIGYFDAVSTFSVFCITIMLMFFIDDVANYNCTMCVCLQEKSIDQNIAAQMQVQPMKIMFSPQRSSAQMGIPASSSLIQQVSRPAASPPEKKSIVQSKASPSLPLKVVQMELEASPVMEHEACKPHASPVVAADTAKENIPALHQNIQPNDDASSLAVELICQRLSSFSLGDTTDLVS
ncbi:hypothetical protein ABZP36_013051 [Zizania latifolia]